MKLLLIVLMVGVLGGCGKSEYEKAREQLLIEKLQAQIKAVKDCSDRKGLPVISGWTGYITECK